MRVIETILQGVYLLEAKKAEDHRGYFARVWDASFARNHQLLDHFDYSCISYNEQRYTLRGMHYQHSPHEEVKLVRCTRGAVYDVVLDLRKDSATFGQWFATELTEQNCVSLYIPNGCAHGFLTLQPSSEVLYFIAHDYVPEAARGVRFDDPTFHISWPAKPAVISDRDASYPLFA